MKSIAINNDIYFLKWNLNDMKRYERIFGNVVESCSVKTASYKNAIGLLWTGLHQENFHGEMEHCFSQTMGGMEQAAAMMAKIQSERVTNGEDRAFVIVASQHALADDQWLMKNIPSATHAKGSTIDDKPEFDTISEAYDNGTRKTSYGLLRLRPVEYEALTPNELFGMIDAVIEDRQRMRDEQDALLASVKQIMLGVAGANVEFKDLLLWSDNAPKSTESTDDEQVNVFKQWVNATGGITI